MSSESGTRKRNPQSKKKKGSTGNISPAGISVREIHVSKPADELIHVQKDVDFAEDWCKVAVFIALSSALAGIAYYVLTANGFGSDQQGDPLTFDWLPSFKNFDFFSSNELAQEPIDEEPSVDVQPESSYLDILWSYYPFGGQSDEPLSPTPTEAEPEVDAGTSKEPENDIDSREDNSNESLDDDKLENDRDDDENDRESEENLDDEKKTDDDDDDDDEKDDLNDDQNDEDNDEHDTSSSADDSENTYESYKSHGFYSYKKYEAEDDDRKYTEDENDDLKDDKDEDDTSDESKEQINRRDQRFNYYHNRESGEKQKYEYIKGEEDTNDSSEQGAREKFDSAENTKDEDDEEDRDREIDSHSSEEVEHDPAALPEQPKPQAPETEGETQSGNMVTKLSVGVALIFVAYSVIIRKWNNYVNQVANEAEFILNVAEEAGDLAEVAQTIAEWEQRKNASKSEAENKTLQDYLETPSNSAGEQSEDESGNEPTADGDIPIDSEKSQTPSETESEIDDDYAPYGTTNYKRMNITNREDWPYRHQLDEADDDWDREDISNSTFKFMAILKRSPKSVRALYGMVRYYDKNADLLKRNSYLVDVIRQYKRILSLRDVPEAIEKIVVEKVIARMRFIGDYEGCVPILGKMVEKYPQVISYQNELAISYLILNKLPEAESILERVLETDPDNGVALVNYGFVMKMKGNLEKSVETLSKGIESGVKGTEDSKFYYHLGEALQRLGKKEEALKLYQKAADKRIFRSKYQRSLYNYRGLKAKPWWSPAETEYKSFFKSLESNWQKIRDEVKSVIKAEKYNTFRDEAEQLRETGEWKQLEIFNRGEEKPECKKFPITCDLIRGFAPAAECRRGQVKFSVMQPGTHVWPHCGPTNCRLRAHLGLIVPNNVTIRVADETRSWREGEVLLFDDSFEHEVWHNGTSSRVVLIVDVWHPQIPEHMRKLLTPI